MAKRVLADDSWHFFVDRGGTFTDVIGLAPSGKLHTRKVLSEQLDGSDATALGVAQLLSENAGEGRQVASIRVGTTVATNALLEGNVAPCALAINAGLGDQLEIGHQNRPSLFQLAIRLPKPLYQHVVEVGARIAADGALVQALDESRLAEDLRRAYDLGLRALAIVLLHAHRYPEHEQRVAETARRIGFTHISTSHEVSPLLGLIARGQTTLVDACLAPIIGNYIEDLRRELSARQIHAPLFFMKSSGELTTAAAFRGRDAVLSGPAGGIVAMVQAGLEAGCEQLIGFDMGGTSADVSHFIGKDIADCERQQETQIAGLRLRAPTLALHTIAAGGGSVLHFDGERFRVGPDSARALPGPTCYGRGGPLSVTDCNVVLGRIQPQYFPKLFGSTGDQALDAEGTREQFKQLAQRIRSQSGATLTPEAIAEGFLRVAVANMANAVKVVSTQKGHDLRDYALVSFGGAAGQHACELARELNMRRVLIPALTSLLSAKGMGLTRVGATRTQSVDRPLGEPLDALVAALCAAAKAELVSQGILIGETLTQVTAALKVPGTAQSFDIAVSYPETMWRDFSSRYEQLLGRAAPGAENVNIDSVRVAVLVSLESGAQVAAQLAPDAAPQAAPQAQAEIYTQAAWRKVPAFQRDALEAQQTVAGPALIVERDSTTYLPAGWHAQVTAQRALLLTDQTPASEEVSGTQSVFSKPDPVLLEVFHGIFTNIAEQMGAHLAASAASVNIRERLDFSCAIFDGAGLLVANAPHVPVHLGSMSATVQDIAERCSPLHDGDVFVSNDPFSGGTHLPDITLVKPVFAGGDTPAFFVAARGHHADVGGIEPGSMPALSRHIDDEGIVFHHFRWFEAGRAQHEELRRILCSARLPARNPEQNIADLKAQLGACETGSAQLLLAVKRYGLACVTQYLGFIQDNAESCVRRAIAALKDGSFAVTMDCGATVRVNIQVDATTQSAHIDFSGTSAQVESNFNCPTAVVNAAVLYVFRCLVDDEIPLNAGCFRPLRLTIPDGSLLAPRYPAATVAGNVETSQAIVDALLGALGVVAASQGSMNNVAFGSARYQYYETVGGGAGAGPGFSGASAVQTHMTNSRITDPEVLELRYPVRVEEHSIRRGSGGSGAFNGGDGVIRRLRLLELMSVSVLGNRRLSAPYGLAGGCAGQPGSAWVERNSGTRQLLRYAETTQLEAGEVLGVATPSGGGFGTRQIVE